jgi:hypothetical protein
MKQAGDGLAYTEVHANIANSIAFLGEHAGEVILWLNP